MDTATKHTQSIKREDSNYVSATCTCGWEGTSQPVHTTTEGWRLAEKEAADHGDAHANGTGWWDKRFGWVNDVIRIEVDPTVASVIRSVLNRTD